MATCNLCNRQAEGELSNIDGSRPSLIDVPSLCREHLNRLEDECLEPGEVLRLRQTTWRRHEKLGASVYNHQGTGLST